MNLKSLFRKFRTLCIHLLTSTAKPLPPGDCVVLAPHPDDETFGCGEMIAAGIQAGNRVEIVILSDGAYSHNGCCDIARETLRDARERDAVKALSILGVSQEHIHFVRMSDGSLSSEMPEHEAEIMDMLNSFGIKTVFVPHPHEGWSDHKAVSQLGDRLQSRGWHRVYYCVWFYFSMPFRKFPKVSWRNARYIENAGCREKKQQAARIYLTDCAPCGKPFAGGLPQALLNAVLSKKEFFFTI